MYSGRVTRLVRTLPLAAALAVAAIPLVQHGRRMQAEAAGEDFMRRLAQSQQAFRQRQHAGFAATIDSLTAPCPGEAQAVLDVKAVTGVQRSGFILLLRAANGATLEAPDCQGRQTVSDYYASLQPASVEAAPRLAYAMTGRSAQVFVFFDGIAPLEPDMAAGGLATPLDALGSFRIP